MRRQGKGERQNAPKQCPPQMSHPTVPSHCPQPPTPPPITTPIEGREEERNEANAMGKVRQAGGSGRCAGSGAGGITKRQRH